MTGHTLYRKDGTGAVALVSILLIIYALAYLDRQIINLLIETLKTDLEISDVQISYLQGLAFVSFYTVCGLPLGFLIDRFPRRPIIFIGILWWSLFSAAGAFATDYTHLLWARFGVGAGEAALLPAAYSMIGDAVSRERLSRAISTFSLGAIAGGALALSLGGYIVSVVSAIGGIEIPVLGHFQSWQLVFLIIGSLGVPGAFLIFLVPEPARQIAAQPHTTAANGHFFHQHQGFYLAHILGFSILCCVMAGNAAWQPAYLQRAFGWDIAKVGAVLGALHLIGGVVGMLGGGMLADHLQKRGYKDAHLRLYVILMPLMTLAAIAAFSSGILSLSLAGISFLSLTAPFIGVAASGLALATPADQRGKASAIFLFSYNLLGFGLGPTIVAWIARHLPDNGTQIGHALSLLFLVGTPLVMGLLWLGLKPMQKAVTAAVQTEV